MAEPKRASEHEPVITKPPDGRGIEPNLRDDPAFRAALSWDQARAELQVLPGGGLLVHGRPGLGPKEIEFSERLPKTRSGKIVRRLLRARELTGGTMDARTAVITSLAHVAPEIDVEHLPFESDLRDELDLDSMDFLNFVAGIHERSGVEIPERDYPQLLALDACIGYVEARLSHT